MLSLIENVRACASHEGVLQWGVMEEEVEVEVEVEEATGVK